MREQVEDTISEVMNLNDGDSICFNMFMDGGCRITRNGDMYELRLIPLYGGLEELDSTYTKEKVWMGIELGYSLT